MSERVKTKAQDGQSAMETFGVTLLGIVAIVISLADINLLLRIAVSFATLVYTILRIARIHRNPEDRDEDQ